MKLVYLIFPGERRNDIESWYVVRTLSESLLLLGYRSKIICFDDYSADGFKTIKTPVAVIFIHVFTYYNYSKYYDILQIINGWNTVFLNNVYSHYSVSNKAEMYKVLEQVGIDIPKTISISEKDSIPTLKFPVVVKPAYGFGGQFAKLCNNLEEVQEALSNIRYSKFQFESSYTLNSPAVIQEYVDDYKDLYIKVQVVEDYYIGGYLGLVSPYEENKFDNFNTHKFRVAYKVEKNVEQIVRSAFKILNISVGACDLLKTNTGYKITDINSLGGYKTFDMVNNTNFARYVASYLVNKIKKKEHLSCHIQS